MNDLWIRLVSIAALCAVALAFTLLLRWARGRARADGFAAWAIVGGGIAGILFGPTVLGRVMPEVYENWFVGGMNEREARDRVISRHGAETIAAQHAGQSREQLADLRDQHRHELTLAIEKWRQSQWDDQTALRTFALAVVAILLFAGAVSPTRKTGHRSDFLTPLSIGVWAAFVPGALVYIAMSQWWGHSSSQSMMAAAACAVGPLILSVHDRRAADRAELGGAHMIKLAGRVASCVAIGGAMYALWLQRGSEGLVLGLPMVAIPVAWLLPAMPAKWARGLHNVLIAVVASLLTIKIDFLQSFAIWPLIVVLIVSDDGRWLGAFVGAMLLGGRKALRTTRLVMGAMSAASSQLALAALAAHSWAAPEAILLPLACGCLLIECTAPLRREFAKRLRALEVEINASQH